MPRYLNSFTISSFLLFTLTVMSLCIRGGDFVIIILVFVSEIVNSDGRPILLNYP
jgi:hypothetical protein